MGLRTPRGKFERLDVLFPARIWRDPDRSDPPIAATCRNVSAKGCRLAVEDAEQAIGFDVDSPIQFNLQLEPNTSEIQAGGVVAWVQRERGDSGRIRLLLGVEFTVASFADRERIKAHIASKLEP